MNDWSRVFFLFYTFLYTSFGIIKKLRPRCILFGFNIYIKNSGDGNCNENYAPGYVFPPWGNLSQI